MAFKTNTVITDFEVTITVYLSADVVADIVRNSFRIQDTGEKRFEKVPAIKALREAFAADYKVTLGLKDAKEIVEAMYSHLYPD